LCVAKIHQCVVEIILKLSNQSIANVIYIYKRLHPRKKNLQQKKRKSRKSNFFMKLNTKLFKFKCGLADRGGGARVQGGGGGLVDPWHGYPHLVLNIFAEGDLLIVMFLQVQK
jgi:hypothetical protein